MNEYEDNSTEKFIERFHRRLSEVDEIAHIVLNGHLEVERHLDAVVEAIFFRPEYLRDARLTFHQKIRIAKAYCPDPNSRDWQVIKELNATRNLIAHRSKIETRADQIAKLREIISGWGTKEFQQRTKAADDKEVVVLAAALCSGFLAYLEDSVRSVRNIIGESLQVPALPEIAE